MCAFCRYNCRSGEEWVLASSIDGRIRLRDEKLKSPLVAARVESNLRVNAAVQSVSWNRRTGSMLILYDAGTASQGTILGLVTAYFAERLTAGRGCPLRGAAGAPPGRVLTFRPRGAMAQAA